MTPFFILKVLLILALGWVIFSWLFVTSVIMVTRLIVVAWFGVLASLGSWFTVTAFLLIVVVSIVRAISIITVRALLVPVLTVEFFLVEVIFPLPVGFFTVLLILELLLAAVVRSV